MERHRLPTSNISCRNQCGFYGNPSWDNYCSRCYRDVYLKPNKSKPAVIAFSQASSQAFSKFEAKRKKIAGKSSSTVRNILKISKEIADNNTNIPDEAVQARNEFNTILENWKPAPANDVVQQITKLLHSLEESKFTDIDAFSMAVQEFYNAMSNKIYNHSSYNDASTDQKEELINAIERFLSVWLYPWAFTPRNTDDEEVDLKLQDKIRSLHWVSHVLLDAPIDPTSPEQSRHLEAAILDLINLNAILPTEGKMDQIVNCCREIFEALHLNVAKVRSLASNVCLEEEDGEPSATVDPPSPQPKQSCANADDFLPTLIWVVLRANPPLLHSNLQFIMRFANDTRLNTGEAAYFFTNLCCAVSFIKELTYESLGLTEEQFEVQMRDGVSVTLCPVDIPDALSESEKRYSSINDRLIDLDGKLAWTENEMHAFHKQQEARISKLRTTYPGKKTVYLDPRELLAPHVLYLGPPESETPQKQSSPSSPMAVPPLDQQPQLQQNFLDDLSLEDVKTPCLVPSAFK